MTSRWSVGITKMDCLKIEGRVMVIVMLVLRVDQTTTASLLGGVCDWVDIHKDTRRKEKEGAVDGQHFRPSLNHRQEEHFTNIQEKNNKKKS